MSEQEKNNLYLLDEQFLNKMAEQKQRNIYARIISLDINENPIEQIEGKITTGSINIDGSSAVRRTCSLTMVSQEVNITDYYWGVKTKFKLEIGLKNNINKKYPDIIWYPQGIYVITTFNTSFSTNNCTISIQGKDKMCLLNGDLGGQIPSEVDFGTEEIVNMIMEPITLNSVKNSKIIINQVLNKYYIKITEEESIAEINTSEDTFYPLYIFIKNKNGLYKKDSKIYYKINENNQSNFIHYDIYKLIQNPDEIFYYSDETFENLNKYTKSNDVSYYSEDNSGKYYLKDIYEKYEDVQKEKIPLEKVILESVHAYGKEPYYNIIINDLDSHGLEQLTYKGEEPLYALYDIKLGEYTNLITKDMNNNFKTIIESNNFVKDNLASIISNSENEKSQILVFDQDFQGVIKNIDNDIIIYDNLNGDELSLEFNENIKIYTVTEITYGDDVGYRLTDLIYTGDLISNAGDTLTSMLDKIKNLLGDFEYFYDIDGRFIFQKKKIYINTSWSQLSKDDDEIYINYSDQNNKFSFNFEHNQFFTAIQNTPVINNIRNDFTVWGKRKSISGTDVPIHARYAIDKKPSYYKALDGKEYYTNQYIDTNDVVDWREIIYQMALDYFAGQGCSNDNPVFLSDSDKYLTDPDQFLYEVGKRNPEYYPTGHTGYEQYYTDMQGFWRQLYNPNYIPEPKFEEGKYDNDDNWISEKIVDYNVEYYIDKNREEIQEAFNNISTDSILNKKYGDYFNNENRLYWNINVFKAPETLNFWIEFLEDETALGKIAISQIGDRTKVVKEDKANSIVYKQIPNIIIYNSNNEKDITRKERIDKTGYIFINMPSNFSQFFTISSRNLSVKDKIDDLLYQHACCTENISLTSIPIYHLEPNTIIYVKDDNTGINGEYIATRFTIPLNYNGTMSITANKAPQRIY